MIWRDTWLLGIRALDKDHKEIVRLMNQLPCCGTPPEVWRAYLPKAQPKSTETPASFIKKFDALISHIRQHFKTEEAFLRSINYPEHHNHTIEHSMDLAEFMEMRYELVESDADALDKKYMMKLKNWFFHHVMVKDRKFADYYQKHRKSNDW